ncbi:uncharacterized protein LOC129791330 isoform X3 [Lutzomyia longipalpis]|uniref:uncharacterized protein LOC129791330 isoform X3 n=1 Tax=Lutzomyia longipalpis TaxID=7200 RepID=UPI002483BF24|nr:uncharacterized protein LOC129791330 isoform X3 [Lutzomyia longipalpis]
MLLKKVRAKFSPVSENALSDAINNRDNDDDSDIDDDPDRNRPIHKSQEIDVLPPDQKTDNPKDKSYKFVNPVRISKDSLFEKLQSLNEKQRQIVMHVYKCFTSNNLPIRIFLSGSAGVGKTRVINCLYQLITSHYDNMPNGNPESLKVLVCAPSGMAAFLINGTTIHRAFALQVTQNQSNTGLSDDVANTIRCKLRDVKLIIVDEVSMVGSNTFLKMDMRSRQIFGVNRSFGGKSVIIVGDLNQLNPVKDVPIYKPPTKSNANIFNSNPLWDEFKYFELTEIMRQKDDLEFTIALNNLAAGRMTQEDIALIKSRTVKDPSEVPDEAIRLFYKRVNVDSFNERKIANFPGELYISTAKDKIIENKATSSKREKENLIHIQNRPPTDTGGLVYELQLKLGIKYMIISNLDVEDGLVNGATGVLRHITFDSSNNVINCLARILCGESWKNSCQGTTFSKLYKRK